MTTTALAPLAKLRFCDNNGNPASGGKLFTYQAGTTTKQTTYTDSTGVTPNANPIILDSRGEANIWLDVNKTYKFTLSPSTDTDPPTNPIWTVDNVAAVGTFTQSGTGAVARTVQSKLQESVSITDFGAVGDGVTNNTAAIQAAFTAAGISGAAVFVPVGNYKFTTTLTIPAGMGGLYGVGAGSILNPVGCDGLTFASSGWYGASRFVRDIFINGTNTSASNNGIIANYSAASGNKVYGVEFRNVTVYGFQVSFYARGFWNCQFYNCFAYNTWYGWYFHGQNIEITLESCLAQIGSGSGTGNSYGVYSDSVAGESAQSINIHNSGFISFAVGIYDGIGLYCTYNNNTVGFCTLYGIEVTTQSSGTVIRDNFVQLQTGAGASAIGIKVDPVGVALYDKVIIDGNTVQTLQYAAGQTGISIGNQQQSVQVTNNRVGSASVSFDIGIANNAGNGAANTVIKWNTISSTTTAIALGLGATNNEVGPTYYLSSGAHLTFAGATPVGLCYYDSGSFTMTLTGYATNPTGTVNWQANGQSVTLTSGIIQGTSNSIAMTGTGLPSFLFPTVNRTIVPIVEDGGNNFVSRGDISATTGIITFSKDASGTGFTASGLKGVINLNCTYTF